MSHQGPIKKSRPGVLDDELFGLDAEPEKTRKFLKPSKPKSLMESAGRNQSDDLDEEYWSFPSFANSTDSSYASPAWAKKHPVQKPPEPKTGLAAYFAQDQKPRHQASYHSATQQAESQSKKKTAPSSTRSQSGSLLNASKSRRQERPVSQDQNTAGNLSGRAFITADPAPKAGRSSRSADRSYSAHTEQTKKAAPAKNAALSRSAVPRKTDAERSGSGSARSNPAHSKSVRNENLSVPAFQTSRQARIHPDQHSDSQDSHHQNPHKRANPDEARIPSRKQKKDSLSVLPFTSTQKIQPSDVTQTQPAGLSKRQQKKQQKQTQLLERQQAQEQKKLEKKHARRLSSLQKRQEYLNKKQALKRSRLEEKQQEQLKIQSRKARKKLARKQKREGAKLARQEQKRQRKLEAKALKQASLEGTALDFEPAYSTSGNPAIWRTTVIFGFCIALTLANVCYTMITKKHFWSGHPALDPAIASSIIEQTIPANRGTIYDRNGTVLAQEIPAYTLYVSFDPRSEEQKQAEEAQNARIREQLLEAARKNGREKQVQAALEEQDQAESSRYVTDPGQTASMIAQTLNVKEENLRSIMENAQANGAGQTELGTGTKAVDKKTKDKLESLRIPGLHFMETSTRYYPDTPMASSLIGYARVQESGQIAGEQGLEASMNQILQESDGLETWRADTSGHIIGQPVKVTKEKQDGMDVVLTLDAGLQKTVQEQMRITMEENKAKAAWCIVMEVETGKILAWSSMPEFNQSTLDTLTSADSVASIALEPGSVMKPFVYAAAIDTGTFPYETLYRAGDFTYTVDEHNQIIRLDPGSDTPYPVIYDALGNDYGVLTFEEGLACSSNVGICELLSNYMKPDTLREYLERFQFGQYLETPYIYQVKGELHLQDTPSYLSSGFGQASSATPLEIVQAYSAIFNEGEMMVPYVVDHLADPHTKEIIEQYEPKSAGTPIHKETAEIVKTMMEAVLQEGMSGERFAIDNLEMSAKTGTGEIYDPNTGTYSTDLYTSSIVAAAPAKDPKILVCYGMQSGNYIDYSPNPFQTIMQAALIANHVSGTSTPSHKTRQTYTMPALVNHSSSFGARRLEGKDLNVIWLTPPENDTQNEDQIENQNESSQSESQIDSSQSQDQIDEQINNQAVDHVDSSQSESQIDNNQAADQNDSSHRSDSGSMNSTETSGSEENIHDSQAGSPNRRQNNSAAKKPSQTSTRKPGSSIIKQYPPAGTPLTSNDTLLLLTNTSRIVMPNMTGWTIKDVNAFIEMTGIQVEVETAGTVISQSIAPGTILDLPNVR